MSNYQDRWQTVKVNVEEGIAWVTLNRPEKRNAMSPTLNREMIDVLETIELDQEAHVLVLTGEGESFSAGMDLKEYFREIDASPEIVQVKVRRDASTWQWKLLRHYAKPTIAMVNGWCFGGAFSPLVACDLAIAADESVFGLSEINWGIPPGNLVSKAMADTVGHREALYYIMTGETFTGPQAAKMGLVNRSVPLTELREATRELAATLRDKNPVVMRAAKTGFKMCRELTWEQNEEYLYAKLDQAQQLDPEQGREQGLKQFLDDKSIKPGLESYHR
ncbi:p-hydroxycinnamoyl CoA hydratase/lyase [Halomonas sp. FeN2]|jgi:feruloyl-CoA hydratase/lyase|uniref:p-hydroxycinnamoyl CoA hydratase/lyase n=1 Tax=Vreelandella neptunia TaxID=115551 RepID=A0ABZ0YKU0_9GAMM|nr:MULTISPECIES: p-hydroxycinnamoyl CoA hydratase/lyase [Halomonas]TDV96595.1 vanillin synthase /trans-feruloyl-CoA hydratase [Halomonas alkaliantarctica]MBF59122.1 p-hydroxycinnamoyl CoA hydratase/lyase [Halomonas sp.]MBL1267578.1 p-hydroxycinnamoyl CoA hydratase/lyase [Halomonas sp.]MDN3560343.1 p-hydroxycinnamoyl CoA hydratase/lyase [Halomonas neptunia]UBR51908.1 p-hydroxycinnamoyl CoA hydratase/lyase [Halomonas sp. FeN2]|tara:strand:- start:3217 stop:4047 length:831 start_codon:yes stop_codon:yes gene_type:complete